MSSGARLPLQAGQRPGAFSVCALVFSVLFAIYGLTYSGAFTADDEHLFLAGAQAVAQAGQFEAPQVYGNSRMRGEWRDVEPLQIVLGAGLVRLAQALGAGRAHTVFLFNSIVTALSACAVLLTVRSREFDWRVCSGAALLFGLGTLAWPYAKTFFRDPLAGLLLAIAYLGFELIPRSRALGWGLLAVGLLGGVLAKSTAAVAMLAFSIASILRSANLGLSRKSLGLVVVAAAGALLVSVLAPASGPLNRLSWSYLASLAAHVINAPRVALTESLLGPFISPGKSLFLYSPPLLLAAFALVAGPARRTWLAPWLLLAGLVIVQAAFYDDQWWGHANWGLRYLLPAVPLLSVAAAPALQRLLHARSALARITLAAFACAGVLAQAPGVAVNARAYFVSLYDLDSAGVPQLAVWRWPTSALIGHWQWLLQAEGIDLALARMPAAPVATAWLLLLAAGLVGLHRLANGRAPGAALWVAVALAFLSPATALWNYARDPLYFGGRESYHRAVAFVAESAGPADLVWVQAYGEPLWHFVMNDGRLPYPWYSLPVHLPTQAQLEAFTGRSDPEPALHPATLSLAAMLERAAYCRLWLLNAPESFPHNLELEHHWLAGRFTLLSQHDFVDAEGRVTVSLFTARPGC